MINEIVKKSKRLLLAVLLAASMVAASPAAADGPLVKIVDQSCESDAGAAAKESYSQTFTAGLPTLSGFEIHTFANGGTLEKVELIRGAQAVFVQENLGYFDGWLIFDLDNSLLVDRGEMFTIRIEIGSGGAYYWTLCGLGNSYPGGEGSPCSSTCDYRFRTVAAKVSK